MTERSKFGKNKTENLNFRLTRSEMLQLKLLAKHTGVPTATLVRRACQDWLQQFITNPPPNLFEEAESASQ